MNSQWPALRRRSSHHSNPLLPRSSIPTSPLPFLPNPSHPTATSVRAFSTSAPSAAKKTYQLKRLAKAKKLLKNIDTSKSTDAFGIREFLDDVESPNESENLLRDIEKKIAKIQRRIVEVEKGTPLASASRAPAPAVSSGSSVADAFDAVGTAIGNDDDGKDATGLKKRKGRRERERVRTREQERFRQGKLDELGVLLAEYKEQAEVIKAEAERQAEMRKRREEVLARKRALLRQLSEHEEEERRASLVRRTSQADGSGGLAEGFHLDDVLDDAMGRVKKMPVHPPREEREYKEREIKDVDVPRVKRVLRPAGTGAVSVLQRGGDEIMDQERVGVASVEGVVDGERSGASDFLPSEMPQKQTSATQKPVDTAAAEDATTPIANVGDPFPPASVQQKPSTKASKPIKKDTPRSPSSPPTSKDDLRLHIPPSGIVPIDADLILSFDSPVPALQSQVLALRNRLKSSYPRIDNLPYDVWTSSNKRTLQTWLKILIGRWNARFDYVDGTGQVDKGIVDERVKEVLDSMVREHDLDNDAAERMAMRWHEAFERRWDMRGDAEGVLDWEEMEAGGMGFLGVETEDPDGEVPVLKQEVGKTSEEVDVEKKNAVSAPVTMAGSGVTTSGVMGRRMYSTSTRRGFWSWSKILGTEGKDEKKEEVKQEPRADAKPDSTTQPKPAATSNAKADVNLEAKPQAKRSADTVSPKFDAKSDAKADVNDNAKPAPPENFEFSTRMPRPFGQGLSRNVLRKKKRQAKKIEDERRMTRALKRGREGGEEQMDIQEQGIEDGERQLGAHDRAETIPLQRRVDKPDKAEESLSKAVPRHHQIVPGQDADTEKPAFARVKRPLQSLSGPRRSRHIELARTECAELPGLPKQPGPTKWTAKPSSLQDFLDSMNEVAAHSPFEAEPRQQQQQQQQQARPLSVLEGQKDLPPQQQSSSSQQSSPQSQPSPSQPSPSPSPSSSSSQPFLPHLTPTGSAHMVSVSTKEHTTRTAIAVGTVYFTNAVPLRLIRSNANKKGDVLGTSRIAGIMAAKKCPDLIPLCHPIALTHVSVELRLFGDKWDPRITTTTKEGEMEGIMGVLEGKGKGKGKMGFGGVNIEAKVQCTGPTGVEMEALTAVMGAALSVVDMCKAVDRAQRVSGVRVVMKEGGRSGGWREGGWRSWQD